MCRDTTKLHPKVQLLITELKKECEKSNLNVLITSCLRDEKEQKECYDKGTSKLLYPNSYHNWGLAFDFCRNVKGKEYDNSDNFFGKVGAIGKKLGLDWGGDFTKKDLPHFQLSYRVKTTTEIVKDYKTPQNYMKTWSSAEQSLKVGSKVKIIKNTTYTGNTFRVYFDKYEVMQIKDDRIVIGVNGVVTCAIHKNNIEVI